MFKPKALTVGHVYRKLKEITQLTGNKVNCSSIEKCIEGNREFLLLNFRANKRRATSLRAFWFHVSRRKVVIWFDLSLANFGLVLLNNRCLSRWRTLSSEVIVQIISKRRLWKNVSIKEHWLWKMLSVNVRLMIELLTFSSIEAASTNWKICVKLRPAFPWNRC